MRNNLVSSIHTKKYFYGNSKSPQRVRVYQCTNYWCETTSRANTVYERIKNNNNTRNYQKVKLYKQTVYVSKLVSSFVVLERRINE